MNNDFFRSFFSFSDPTDDRSNMDSFGGMFREMDRMMRDVDRLMRSQHFEDHFDSNFLEAPHNDSNEGNSLRSRMLKSDDEVRRGTSDVNFDDRVAKYGLRSVLDTNDVDRRPQTEFSHFATSSSFRKIISGDGKVEEHRIQRDSRGNKVETVTRQLGDKVYSVTKKHDPSGQIEENQNLYNLSEDELKDFEDKWDRGIGYKQTPRLPYTNANESEKPSSIRSAVDSVLGWFKK